jgi:pseudouridine-5'-phosphate glycosidase
MARPQHYSPVISRFLVSVLYHEAKHRKIPMTKLTDDLLLKALRGTAGWTTATNLRLAEENTQQAPVIAQAA